MSLTQRHAHWLVLLSFAIALALSTLPLPAWIAPYRPEWVPLVLVYWNLALPQRVGVGYGWLLGLLLDVTKGTLLGMHALALAVVAYVAVRLHRRIRVYPLWQQSFTILALVAFVQFFVLWIKGIIGQGPTSWQYWLPTLTSALIWPWLFVILRDLRRRFRVT